MKIIKKRGPSVGKKALALHIVVQSFFLISFLLLLTGASCDGKENEILSTTEKPENGDDSLQTVNTALLAGTDELGRSLPDYTVTGLPKENRSVAMFYFLWQGDKSSKTSKNSWDLSKLIPQHPEVLEDKDNPNWGSTGIGAYYFWGEPIYGYYRGDDYWVHLRNMQLLTDAGVDFLVLDATNAIIYEEQSEALMRAIKDLQGQGANPPRLVYYTNTASGKTMQRIYNAFYKPTATYRFSTTWYYLDGKPLIIGRTKEAAGTDYESFFTFREAQWPNEPEQLNGWPWIDFHRPQSVFQNLQGQREIINVSVAQHPNPGAGMGGSAFYGNMDNWGRSYHNGQHGDPEQDIRYGYNFQEQWDYALQQDPPFIFITGWNEWIAGRWNSHDGHPEHSFFVDQASPEYSRDIEPTYTAGLNDNYYLQLTANIRRYKGVNPPPTAKEKKTIRNFADWMEVEPTYYDYRYDTQHRNHPGAQSVPSATYTNITGRNDFRRLKVARDNQYFYFYAETTEKITETKENNWMRLFINSDRRQDTGWAGFDFRIEGGKMLQAFRNGEWKTLRLIDCVTDCKQLMYVVPAADLGIETSTPNFEFKWSDNMQNDTDPMDWYVNGDTAPGGRLNFVYRSDEQ